MMPTICMFLGILISMYYSDNSQHHTPHFHAKYGEYEAVYSLAGELIAGKLPQKQHNYVVAWAMFHEDDLKADWELALNGKEPFKIEPLRF